MGSCIKLDELREGVGPFAKYGVKVFDDFCDTISEEHAIGAQERVVLVKAFAAGANYGMKRAGEIVKRVQEREINK